MPPVLLYVDDDPTSRDVMQMLVTFVLGWDSLTIFENTENFIARLEVLSPLPDVILLDIRMCPYDGFDALKMLRQHAQFANTPVVAVTAGVMNEEVELLKQAHFDGAVAKPICIHNFPQLIERILKGEKVWFIR
jgi:CheY-like chemotaxis protein